MYRSLCDKNFNFIISTVTHVHRDITTTTTLVNLTSTHTIITATKCLQHVQPRIYKEYPEVYKELKWQCIAMFSGVLPTSMASYMHALALASLKTWNPKESAGRETVLLASCSTGSSSGREVLSTSCSRWPFRVTCLGKIEMEREIEREREREREREKGGIEDSVLSSCLLKINESYKNQ